MIKIFGTIWDKFWRDDSGRVVVWQMPNIPLIAWAVLTCLSLMFNRGHVSDILSWAGSTALIIWSLLEIFKGVNYFRRLLGLAVLYYALVALLRSL